jgi:hypothetical protein
MNITRLIIANKIKMKLACFTDVHIVESSVLHCIVHVIEFHSQTGEAVKLYSN